MTTDHEDDVRFRALLNSAAHTKLLAHIAGSQRTQRIAEALVDELWDEAKARAPSSKTLKQALRSHERKHARGEPDHSPARPPSSSQALAPSLRFGPSDDCARASGLSAARQEAHATISATRRRAPDEEHE